MIEKQKLPAYAHVCGAFGLGLFWAVINNIISTMGLATIQHANSVAEAKGLLQKTSDIEGMHSYQSQTIQTERRELKGRLKSLLAQHNGCTKHPDVVQTIEELSALNPTDDTFNSALFLGEFHALTSPNFPGRINPSKGQEDVVQYMLGRLSFNIFQPHKLVCTLRSVRNPVSLVPPVEGDGKKVWSYPLILDITIHSPLGDLPAILENEATCSEHAEQKGRLMVSFSGGTLMPAKEVARDPSKLKMWAQTFEGAYKKADEERSNIGRMFQYILKLLLGLTLPTDDSLLKNHFHFDLKRSPVGYLDVLYLDGDLRITKGNRGTLVVVERATMTVPHQ
jgi:hypothetical protein